jgi:GT2 family glycosyltransferase
MSNCIHICIPVFNRVSYTLKCIESIKNQTYANYRIIICDDGSTDGTYDILTGQFPEITVLKGTGNLWWAGATNMCVKKALSIAEEGDFIYTLNNDTELVADSLTTLIEFESKFPDSIIGSVNLFYNDHFKIEPSAFKRTNKYFFKLLPVRIHNLGDPLPTDIDFLEVDAFAGKGVLIPVEVFKKIGLYNSELLPQYHGDTEFTVRAKDSGFRLFYYYKSKVLSHQYLTGTGTMNKNYFEFLRSFKNIKSAIHYKSVLNLSKLIYGKKYKRYLYWQLIKINLGFFKRFFKSSYQ